MEKDSTNQISVTNNSDFSQKMNHLYILLSSFFIGNAMIAELVGTKIFSMQKLLGFSSITMFHSKFDLDLSVGVIIWPFVFISSDIINEFFGKKGLRKISVITTIIILYSSIILVIGGNLPPADSWLENYKTFNIDHAYSAIFRQGVGIIIGSVTAFLVSQLIDAYVFHFFRKITGHKMLALRSTGSTVISQIFDSFIVTFIAFYIFNNYKLMYVLKVGVIAYIVKITVCL